MADSFSWPTVPPIINAIPELEEGLQGLTVAQIESTNEDGHCPQGRDSEQEALCMVCQLIDLKVFFCSQDQEPFRMHIGFVRDIVLKKMKCKMCHLIFKALEQSWTDMPVITQTGGMGALQRGEVFYISWKPGQPLITPQLAESMGSVEMNEIVLRRCKSTTCDAAKVISIHVFCQGEEVKRGTSWMGVGEGVIGKEKFQPELRLLGDDAHLWDLEQIGHGRKYSRVCETPVMAKWYDECKNKHPDCSRPRIVSEAIFETPKGEEVPKPKLPPGTRFIDVQKMRLVTAGEECEFFALSYVWGKSENENLQTKMQNVVARGEDDGLRNLMFPKTIADGISLTAELGIKYLWVDSLCIIQDDDEKAIQIQNMDRIYGLASLVIVGAAGADANTGLIGYTDSPRAGSTQFIQRVHGVQLVVSSPPLRDVLAASKWSMRGWTFQEWYLARRAIVFTDQQVYYICSNSSFSEDLYLESIPSVTTEALATQKHTASALLRHLPSHDLPLTPESGWTEYQRLVESYTPRELTDESDTLLAISGLLNNLHRASRNRFLCGISIGLFHDALFWVPVSGNDFRKVSEKILYPTWSWAGWKGAVKYGVFPASQQSLVENWIVQNFGDKLGILGTDISDPQNERFVVEEAMNTSGRPIAQEEEAETQLTWVETFPPNYMDDCCLAFEAPAATLQISPGTIDNSASNADALVNLEGRYLGVAVLNFKPWKGTEVLTRQWDTFLCIAISISNERMPYTREKAFLQLPEDDEWVNIILLRCLEKIFIRVGVGQVSKWRWENYAKPEMKSIWLG